VLKINQRLIIQS